MKNKRNEKTRGQSLVEAALALPVLVMLMLGLLDFGRAYYALVALRDAAEEGATYAAIYPKDAGGVKLRASEASRQLVPINPNDVSVIYPSALAVGAPITVTTQVTLELYTPFGSSFFPEDWLVLEGRATHSIISVR
jgi:hypothetical protein